MSSNQSDLLSRTVVTYDYDLTQCITIAYDEFDSICAAWEQGKKRWSGKDEFGEYCVVSLKNVVAIAQTSCESRQMQIQDQLNYKKLAEPII